MKIDQITSQINKGQAAIDNSVNTAKNAANRVQSTVENAERGIKNTVDSVSQLSNRAGETFNKLISGGSELTNKIGNLFGGSDTASVGGTKTAGSSASGVSPGQKVPGFASNTKETLPSQDPLKRDVSEPFKKKDEEGLKALDYLNPGGVGKLLDNGWTSIRSLTDSALSGIGTDINSVKKRLESTMNIAGQLAKLPSEISQEVNGFMSEVNNMRYQITSIVDDVQHTFDSYKDLDDFLAIDNLINSFKGSDSFSALDINTSSALIYGLSTKLNSYGLPSKIEPMLQAISDAQAKEALYGELMIQAAATGNLDSTEYYLDKLQPGQGAQIATTVIQNLMANLRVETGVSFKTYGTRLLALFKGLDAKWDKAKNITPEMTELKLYTYAGVNAIQALLTTEKRNYVIAAGSVSYQSTDEIVEDYFAI
ncbi:hypothetical protein [Escherichia coli]|uniref:hypothetical protein n=1 Tax=Escherichia coli TaxID=562 RepID=UPI000A0F97CD|nr:hypothetical protein [Escherichia coli]ORS90245.1 hypothetical protein BHS87_26620 [Escherichia coli]